MVLSKRYGYIVFRETITYYTIVKDSAGADGGGRVLVVDGYIIQGYIKLT